MVSGPFGRAHFRLAMRREPAIFSSAMSRPENSLPGSPTQPERGPGRGRSPVGRRDALGIAGIYLIFATFWLTLSHSLLPRLVDQSRVPYLELLEDGAFALCTGLVLYMLVMRFVRQHALDCRSSDALPLECRGSFGDPPGTGRCSGWRLAYSLGPGRSGR